MSVLGSTTCVFRASFPASPDAESNIDAISGCRRGKSPPPVKRYSMTLGIFKVFFGRRLSNVDPYTLNFLVTSHTIFRHMNYFAIVLLTVLIFSQNRVTNTGWYGPWRCGLGAHRVVFLYLVALLHLPSFFRFVVLV
jgi:hypothetical protein